MSIKLSEVHKLEQHAAHVQASYDSHMALKFTFTCTHMPAQMSIKLSEVHKLEQHAAQVQASYESHMAQVAQQQEAEKARWVLCGVPHMLTLPSSPCTHQCRKGGHL